MMPSPTSQSVFNAFSPDMQAKIRQAADILKAGGLVALPTETVYGLGANAENPEALARMYAVKGRPVNHPVIVHIASARQLGDWAVDIPEAAWLLAEAFWPGPLTLILKRSSRVPDSVTGGQDTVGIRVPSHPMALALLQTFGGGVAAPSANRFGKLSPTSAAHVQADLGNDVDLILDGGDCAVGVESTIVAFQDGQPVILRPGMITAEQIRAVLAQPKELQSPGSSASTVSRAPGTLASHYAPGTPLALLSGEALDAMLLSMPSGDVSVGVLSRRACPARLRDKPWLVWRQMDQEPDGYARSLYAQLRELDALTLDRILVESVPVEDDAWAAVADRLNRAAY